MVYTPIPKGTDPWDAQVNGAFTDQDARLTVVEAENGQQWNEITVNRNNIAAMTDFVPSDYGLLAWTYDPVVPSGALAVPAGVVHMVKVKINTTTTINNLSLGMSATSGTVFTAGNFIGIYDGAGNRLGQSTDQVANWSATGWRQTPLTAGVPVTPGYYYIAILINFTGTAPQLVRGSSLSATPVGQLVNLTLTAANARLATSGTGLTALPATIDMAARTLSTTSWWVTASV